MNDSFHIWEIMVDGWKTIRQPIRRWIYLFFYPICIASISIGFFKISIPENYVSIIISSISIFTGFFFTLIVYVADKATNKKRELQNSKEEEDDEFLSRYLVFSENLISQISYSIVIAIFIILAVLLTQSNYSFENQLLECTLQKLENLLALSLISHFFIFLLIIVSSMYALFLNEVKKD